MANFMEFKPPRTADDWEALEYEASTYFSPSAPIDERDLFAGRQTELRKMIEAVVEKGKHAVLYGERGVGKTSLAKIFRLVFPSLLDKVVLVREQVDPSDDFTSIWRRVFKDIDAIQGTRLVQATGELIAPDDIRRALERSFKVSDIPVIVIDEFDKVDNADVRTLMANVLKNLSDYAVNATVVLVGVADDIGDLLDEHASLSRCIEQILMPRMSNIEMREILNKRLPRLGMKIEGDALWKIVTLARGLPSYVHLLGLYATQDAIRMRRLTITEKNVDAAIKRALEKSQESIQREYAAATHTNRSDTLFSEVLLACALAKTDDRGLFSPNSVVAPLQRIMDRPELTIANFQNHLKKFISDERRNILVRRGSPRAYKFRFRDPMMQPFIVMKGVESGLIDASALGVLSSPEEPELPIGLSQPS